MIATFKEFRKALELSGDNYRKAVEMLRVNDFMKMEEIMDLKRRMNDLKQNKEGDEYWKNKHKH